MARPRASRFAFLLSAITLNAFLGLAGNCQAPTSASISLADQVPTNKRPLRIAYTGSLFGYYRDVVAGDSASTAKYTDSLVSQFQNGGWSLRLAMGDNFAPEFGASLQSDRSIQGGPANCHSDSWSDKGDLPEKLYKTDTRIAPRADCDNVASFLHRAGYRAIVPGREDFIYGAGWLRTMAWELENYGANAPALPNQLATKAPAPEALTVLSANLRMSVSQVGHLDDPKGAVPDLKNQCPLLFGKDNEFPSAESQCTPQGLPSLLDWLNRMDATLNEPVELAIDSKTSPATTSRARPSIAGIQRVKNEFDALMAMSSGIAPNLPSRKAIRDQISKLSSKVNVAEQTIELQPEELKKELSTLDADIEQLQCSSKDDAATCNFQQNIASFESALSRSLIGGSTDGKLLIQARIAGRDAILGAILAEQRNVGYTIADGGRVLIIGVVGQTTMAEISLANRTFCFEQDGSLAMDCDRQRSKSKEKALIQVLDPLANALAVLRAASLANPSIESVVIMAQMPHAEADELGARLTSSINTLNRKRRSEESSISIVPSISLVISKAEVLHATGDQTLTINGTAGTPPVMTPVPAYTLLAREQSDVHPASTVTLTYRPLGDKDRLTSKREQLNSITLASLENTRPAPPTNLDPDYYATAANPGHNYATAATLLAEQIVGNNIPRRVDLDACRRDPSSFDPNSCEIKLSLFLLEALTRTKLRTVPSTASRAQNDIAMLQARDVYFGFLPSQYTTYADVCGSESPSPCSLRVALDRVLWKGDFAEEVMVSGSDVQDMLKVASAKSSAEQTLAAQDASKEWLRTFGIISKPTSNLTQLYLSSDSFSVPVDLHCVSTSAGVSPDAPTYCLNESPLQTDGSYWIVTSDHLAEDKSTYSTLAALPPTSHITTSVYLSEAVMVGIRALQPMAPNPDITAQIQTEELHHQQRPLFHMDFAKMVAGFNSKKAVGGDPYIASTFQGVTDSRATTPSQQELDLEGQVRGYYHFDGLGVGIQSDVEYDRSVQGNLAGKPVNPSFPLNSFSIGPFIQKDLSRNLSHVIAPLPVGIIIPAKLYVVASPQYQRQLKGNYLYFGFGGGAKGELTIPTNVADGVNFKVGLRGELSSTKKWYQWDTGSYSEIGGEYFLQRNVFAGLTLTNTPLNQTITCSARSTLTISNCVSNNPWQPLLPAGPLNDAGKPITIDANTRYENLTYASVNAWGMYWDIHLEKTLPQSKFLKMVFETKGDGFLRRSGNNTLSTQTLYDVPLSFAFTFQVLPNLSFAPSYNAFFFSNQISENHLLVNGFTISARWYYDRDSAVPFLRQLRFKGPSSLDLTKSAHLKTQ